MIAELFILNVCHFVGDYTHASRPWMLAAKRHGRPIGPIAAHAGVHAALVTIAMLFYCPAYIALGLGVFQFITHWAIDTAKGRIQSSAASLSDPTSYWHWWLFGADQFAHQSVLIVTACIAA